MPNSLKRNPYLGGFPSLCDAPIGVKGSCGGFLLGDPVALALGEVGVVVEASFET